MIKLDCVTTEIGPTWGLFFPSRVRLAPLPRDDARARVGGDATATTHHSPASAGGEERRKGSLLLLLLLLSNNRVMPTACEERERERERGWGEWGE